MTLDNSNRYFICLSYEEEPIPWDLQDPSQQHAPPYFRKVLLAMERTLEVDDLTFYLTWKLDELPSYGDNVIALVMGDEWCRIPRYVHNVLATFKCYGTQLTMGIDWFHQPFVLNLLLCIKYLRTILMRLPGRLRYAVRGLKYRFQRAHSAPLYDLPLGYGNQLDLPLLPISKRSHDIFFAGSIKHSNHPAWQPQHWLRSPKDVSRQRMVDQLTKLDQSDSSIDIRLVTSSAFALNALFYNTEATADMLDEQAYSEQLMNSKICLVPRGTSLETFRFYEALRYGCVPITEHLPDRWFYTGAPVIELKDWSHLSSVVKVLLDNPHRLQEYHEAGVRWWREVCSEEVVGNYIASRVKYHAKYSK
jgi:hypothetical protein